MSVTGMETKPARVPQEWAERKAEFYTWMAFHCRVLEAVMDIQTLWDIKSLLEGLGYTICLFI